MKLLLDTQVFLWMHLASGRLSSTTRGLLEDTATGLLLSPVSSWEIVLKHDLGKLTLPEPAEVWVPARMSASLVASLPVTHAHTLAVAGLPWHHRDPFDRLLVAQARTEGIPLLSADQTLARYDVEIVPA